jgi:hypothetical protein
MDLLQLLAFLFIVTIVLFVAMGEKEAGIKIMSIFFLAIAFLGLYGFFYVTPSGMGGGWLETNWSWATLGATLLGVIFSALAAKP